MGRALLAYTLVVILAGVANRTGAPWRVLFWVACVSLPWLDGCRPAQVLALRRRGWGLTVAALSGMVVLPYALLIGVTQLYQHTLFLHPGGQASLDFVARQALQWLPLALAEELFFRGYWQERVGTARWGRRGWGLVTYKNLAATLLFGLAHALLQPSWAVLSLLGGSLLLGWLIEHSEESIWPVTVLHAAGNLALAWFTHLAGLNGLSGW